MPARTFRWAVAGVVLGIVLAACETTKIAGGHPGPQDPPVSPAPPAAEPNSGGPFGFASSGNADFDSWRTQFASRAAASGRREGTIRSVLDGLVPVIINITPVVNLPLLLGMKEADFGAPLAAVK